MALPYEIVGFDLVSEAVTCGLPKTAGDHQVTLPYSPACW
jgi:hypothetical protein